MITGKLFQIKARLNGLDMRPIAICGSQIAATRHTHDSPIAAVITWLIKTYGGKLKHATELRVFVFRKHQLIYCLADFLCSLEFSGHTGLQRAQYGLFRAGSFTDESVIYSQKAFT